MITVVCAEKELVSSLRQLAESWISISMSAEKLAAESALLPDRVAIYCGMSANYRGCGESLMSIVSVYEELIDPLRVTTKT